MQILVYSDDTHVMINCTCTSCRTYQKVTADRIERIDDGVLGPVAWFRCVGCEQTAPTRVTRAQLDSSGWSLAA